MEARRQDVEAVDALDAARGSALVHSERALL